MSLSQNADVQVPPTTHVYLEVGNPHKRNPYQPYPKLTSLQDLSYVDHHLLLMASTDVQGKWPMIQQFWAHHTGQWRSEAVLQSRLSKLKKKYKDMGMEKWWMANIHNYQGLPVPNIIYIPVYPPPVQATAGPAQALTQIAPAQPGMVAGPITPLPTIPNPAAPVVVAPQPPQIYAPNPYHLTAVLPFRSITQSQGEVSIDPRLFENSINVEDDEMFD